MGEECMHGPFARTHLTMPEREELARLPKENRQLRLEAGDPKQKYGTPLRCKDGLEPMEKAFRVSVSGLLASRSSWP
jgi:hypothetical protein